jgi:hypothetical protein
MKNVFIIALLLHLYFFAFTQNISADKPELATTNFKTENIPESEINVPIQIDLQPFYSMANKKVDTLFTSPNYPNDWVQSGCNTRYKYSFRRGPLRFNIQNTTLTIGFTGYYKMIGSTRGCVNGTVLSPWTPDCKCGFDEGERRVNVSYTIDFTILTRYAIKTQIIRNEPVPLDKCTVCFWGQDITSSIMDALKKEMDASKADLEKNFKYIELKPQFQKMWDLLNTPYNLNNFGWLQINPQNIRLNRIEGKFDKLIVNIGLSAKPVMQFEKPLSVLLPAPHLSSFNGNEGFNINVDAMLNYDSLSNILNQHIAGKEFDFNKAFIHKKFIFQDCHLLGSNNERLIIRVKFTGSNDGYFYVTGTPVYDAVLKTLAITDIDFDVKSKNALLKTADWLFSKKITSELESMAKYDVSGFINEAKSNLGQQLNREFMKGVKGTGNITDVGISGIFPRSDKLIIRANAKGNLSVNVGAVDFSF